MTLLELLDSYQVSYQEGGSHRHVREGWVGVDCYTCSPGSSKFKLGIRTDSGACSCWTCGPKRLPEVLEALLGVPPKEAYSLARTLGEEGLPLALGHTPDAIGGSLPPRGVLTWPRGLGALLKQHRAYLQGRGLDADEVERLWGLKGIGIAPKLAWRVVIPILYKVEPVSWTSRAIGDVSQRYVNASPDQEKKDPHTLLFGEDFVRHSLILCEGPFDVFRIGPGAVALLGLNYSPAQFNRILKYPVRTICFDNEPAAQRRARKLLEDLSVFAGETRNVVLDAKDPSSASEREVRLLRRFLK